MKKYIKSAKSTIPRNATRLRATGKYEYNKDKAGEFYKDKYGWRKVGEEDSYPSVRYDPSYLRNGYDIEVIETDPDYKPNKTRKEYVVQGNYGYGWNDLTYSDDYREAKADLKSYEENEQGVAHRIITRRVPIER